VSKLYRKIQSGVYEHPNWLSSQAAHVIKRCLTVDPTKRVSIEELMQHQWVVTGHHSPIIYWSNWTKYEFDETVVGLMSQFFASSRREIKLRLADWQYDSFVSVYMVLLRKKQRGEPIEGVLKKPRSASSSARPYSLLPRSPSCSNYRPGTHDNTMENSMMEQDDVFEAAPDTPKSSFATPKRNNDRMPLIDRTPQYTNASANEYSNVSTFKTPLPPKTPNRARDALITPFRANRRGGPGSNYSPQRTHSCDVLDTPSRIREFGSLRKPSSRLASIEDNLDRIVDLLTPKKRASLTSGPRHTRCFGNVALGTFIAFVLGPSPA
jgi:maternal embryonic leucine zipper kinase